MHLVLEDDVQSVDDSGNVTKDGQQDVDEEICAATTLKEDTKRRKEDGENDLADIASGEGHFDCWVFFLKEVVVIEVES